MSQSLPTTNISFPNEEEKILKYWKEIDAFRSSLKQSKGKPRLVKQMYTADSHLQECYFSVETKTSTDIRVKNHCKPLLILFAPFSYQSHSYI